MNILKKGFFTPGELIEKNRNSLIRQKQEVMEEVDRAQKNLIDQQGLLIDVNTALAETELWLAANRRPE